MSLDVRMFINGSKAGTKSDVPWGNVTLNDLKVGFYTETVKDLRPSNGGKEHAAICLSRYPLTEPEKTPLETEQHLLQTTNFMWFQVI